MGYFDKSFFKLLFGLSLIILLGLIFVTEVQADHAVNINTATLEELDTLPGVGPATAQNIVNGRPYATVQEISRADGIGEPGSSSYNNIIDHITVGETSNQTQNSEGEEDEEELVPAGSSSSALEVKALKLSVSGDNTGVIGQPMEFRAETNSDKLTVKWVLGDGGIASALAGVSKLREE